MAIKFLDENNQLEPQSNKQMLMQQEAPSQEENQLGEAGTIQGLVRSGLSGLVGFPGVIESLARGIGGLIPNGGMVNKLFPNATNEQIFPTPEDILKQQEKTFGNQYRPTNFLTKGLNLTAKNSGFLASLIATGAPLAATVLWDVLGSVGMEGAKGMGFGPLGQIAGSLLGAKAGRGITKLKDIKNFRDVFKNIDPTKLIPMAEAKQAELFTKEKELGSAIKFNAEEYGSKIRDLLSRIRKSSFKDEAQKKWVDSVFSNLLEDAYPKEMSPSQLVERQQEINRLWPNVLGHTDKAAKHIFDQGRAIITNQIKDVGKNHPEWFKAWEGSQQLTQALKGADFFKETLKEIPKLGSKITSPLAKYLLSGGIGVGAGLAKGTAVGAATSIGAVGAAYGAKEGAKVLAFLTQGKEPMKLFAQASKNMAARNYPAAAKSIMHLNQEAKKFEEKYKEPEQESKGQQVPGSSIRFLN